MINSFSIDELMIRVMPGGALLGVVYFVFGDSLSSLLSDNLDFLYTFLFFCSAFIVGEILQLVAHELEFLIDLFFRFRRPSKVFLYQKNPVLKSEHKRLEILAKLNLGEDRQKLFDRDYSNVPLIIGRSKESDDLSQSIFWTLFSNVSHTDEMKLSNRNYLFARVVMVDFLIIGILFFIDKEFVWGEASFALFLLFLWRSRGIARGLVFKTVLLNLRDN